MTVVVRRPLVIRLVGDDEVAEAGRIVAASYLALPGYPTDPEGYDREIADVASRRDGTDVVVAELDGRLVGCLTYIGDVDSPYAEHGIDGAATFRYFGVAPSVQGGGVGSAMLQWVIGRARADGKSSILLHTLESMISAQRLYQRFGFRRDPERDADWDGVRGVAYALDLLGASGVGVSQSPPP